MRHIKSILPSLALLIMLALATVLFFDNIALSHKKARTYSECYERVMHDDRYRSKAIRDRLFDQDIKKCTSLKYGWPFKSSIHYANGSKETIHYNPSYHFCYTRCSSIVQRLDVPQVIYNFLFVAILYTALYLIGKKAYPMIRR